MNPTLNKNLLPFKPKLTMKELAQDIVQRAIQADATAAECVIREGDEFSTLVRLGEVETLKESGSKSIGVRIFHGKRAASTHSSDFTRAGLDRMLSSALELAKITSEDPFSGIPEPSQPRLHFWRSRPLLGRRIFIARRRAHQLRAQSRKGRPRF